MFRLAAVVVALLSTLSLSAGIGQTEVQCEAQYGSSVEGRKNALSDGDYTQTYSSKGLDVRASFSKGKCVELSISGVKRDAVESTLETNSKGVSWSKINGNKWASVDGKYSAEFFTKDSTLNIKDILGSSTQPSSENNDNAFLGKTAKKTNKGKNVAF